MPTGRRSGGYAKTSASIGAFRTIRERGLSIPDDVALVGFDEVDRMAVVQPPLAVAVQPTRGLGRTAAELLLHRIADGAPPAREVLLESTIVIRQSCADYPGPDAVQQAVVEELLSTVR